VKVCSRNLSYSGLIDFGEDGMQSNNIEDQATHGLVFMFSSLCENFSQPFGVFASKGPVKGEELAKLLISAIIYIENCGGLIHGAVCDGASTNTRMRKLLRIDTSIKNLRTYFEHPCNEKRKVFMFSDVPHIIKCIRNRLHNNKILRVSIAFIFLNLYAKKLQNNNSNNSNTQDLNLL